MALRSSGSDRFWQQYQRLPPDVKRIARQAFRRFLQNPWHPSFQRKQPQALAHRHPPIHEFRITLRYRALCEVEGDDYRWIFIGDHVAFDREVRRLAS